MKIILGIMIGIFIDELLNAKENNNEWRSNTVNGIY